MMRSVPRGTGRAMSIVCTRRCAVDLPRAWRWPPSCARDRANVEREREAASTDDASLMMRSVPRGIARCRSFARVDAQLISPVLGDGRRAARAIERT
jgi:hypothetical protein